MIKEEQHFTVKSSEQIKKKSKIPDILMFLFVFSFVATFISMYYLSLNQTKEETLEKLNANYKEINLSKELEPLILKNIKIENKNILEENIFILLSNSVYNIFYINENNKLKKYNSYSTSNIRYENLLVKSSCCLDYLIYHNKKWYINNEIQKTISKPEIEIIIKNFISDFNKEETIKKSWE